MDRITQICRTQTIPAVIVNPDFKPSRMHLYSVVRSGGHVSWTRDLALMLILDGGEESLHATDTTVSGRPLILTAMRSRDAHGIVQILLQAKGDPNQIDQEDVNQQVPTGPDGQPSGVCGLLWLTQGRYHACEPRGRPA